MTLFSCSQPKTKTAVLNSTTWTHGLLYRSDYDTIILANENLDLNFFKKRFNILYSLPDTLIHEKYKNQTIKLWALDTSEDLHTNWFNTFIYDRSGRLKYYSYSGCIPCSQFPFEYNIIYKPTGELDRIFDQNLAKKDYRFFYRKDGQIVTIEIYEDGKLSKSITRLT